MSRDHETRPIYRHLLVEPEEGEPPVPQWLSQVMVIATLLLFMVAAGILWWSVLTALYRYL